MTASRGRSGKVGRHHGGRRWEGKGGQASQTLVQLGTWSKTPATGAVDLSATRIPPGPDYTGGGGFSLPIDLTIYLCLIEFLGRPNQSHAHKQNSSKKKKQTLHAKIQ